MVNSLLTFASVMKSVGGVALAIIVLLVMVTIHEFGHYVVGKWLGFRINEFSVGFGPAVLKKRSKKTGELFALRVIPLGGFCAFDGEDEIDEPTQSVEDPFLGEYQADDKKDGGRVEPSADLPIPKGARFNDQAPWKRILVLLAGAFMNYVLALTLIITLFACFGRPVYEVVIGETDETKIESVEETAWQSGDVILKIDGRNVYMITDYMDVLDGKKKGESVDVLVLRGGREKSIAVTLLENADFVNMSDTRTLLFSLGIADRNESGEVVRSGGLYSVSEKSGFFGTIGHSFAYSWKIGGTVLRSLGELLTGKLGLEAMGGPITTIKVTSEVASSGFASLLNIASFIGVNLAVFNLLPIPALDGSKVIFCLIEWIRKKPVNRKIETMIHFVGILFLFGFAILVDILQLF